ncbi:NACHT domain-containing protein [Nostoc sp. FACHB-133]|uniref:NACHT domain-containing protein n=3 Tax=Nostoc TaxID=1177 RepID=A0ABR8IKA2_9NOSO|nr:NACHT domain-containing protein [Nostoc sp. FACHB-133]MBD2526916.1 NACHT domain-containing protein [Nostoc sp. FACHB-133]MBD2565532.1 NACHT domain-containing protein [Nostoc linckia FACHB-391]MBD2651272.1 NACHT domain-containing protein [Nostoc foliaceum FACHB-393]
MDFSAESRLKSTNASSVLVKEQKVLGQRFSADVTFEDALAVVDNLVLTERRKRLSPPEILVIKAAWDGKEYKDVASNSTYSLNYLQRRVASPLWNMLSTTIGDGERVEKQSLRYFLERVTKKYQFQDAIHEQQTYPAKNRIQVIGTKSPDVSSFYGRVQELIHLKELAIKQRSILLVGAAGIGKSALAAKLLEELSLESQPRFDCLIWKSVAHAPLVQDLVGDLIELIQPTEISSSLPEHTQSMISILIKQLQSRRCLLVLDASEALFQTSNFQYRRDYGLFFRRLTEELCQSCVIITSRVFPDEIESLIAAELPIDFLRIEGLEADAALQLLSSKGLIDQEKCNDLIKTYRGNPSELKAVINRIHHFFGGSTEKFFENPTTLVSDQFQEMLNHVFSQLLSRIQKRIMIYLTEEVTLNSQYVSFAKLLNDMNREPQTSVSKFELIKALEVLEKHSLIETIKDPITEEISFNLEPVVKKYIKTDPQGWVYTSKASSNFPIAS